MRRRTIRKMQMCIVYFAILLAVAAVIVNISAFVYLGWYYPEYEDMRR